MKPLKRRALPGRIGLFVFLLLAAAVVSTQAQNAHGQVPLAETQQTYRGPLVLRAADMALQFIAPRSTPSAGH